MEQNSQKFHKNKTKNWKTAKMVEIRKIIYTNNTEDRKNAGN